MTPYNKTMGPPRRMKEYLEVMLKERESVRFAADDPESLAYKLREAIHASQFHDKYEHFYELKSLYTIRVKDDHVKAEITKTQPVRLKDKNSEGEDSEEGDSSPPTELTRMQIPEAEDLPNVVEQTMEKSEEGYDELRFPNATLMTPHLRRLYSWASKEGWSIINQGDAGLILTQRHVDEALTWTPEEVE